MPNIESAKKRTKQIAKRRMVNVARKSKIKTAIRRVTDALEENDIARAKDLLNEVQAQLSRAKGKGVLHANTAARKMSRLAQTIKKQDLAKTA